MILNASLGRLFLSRLRVPRHTSNHHARQHASPAAAVGFAERIKNQQAADRPGRLSSRLATETAALSTRSSRSSSNGIWLGVAPLPNVVQIILVIVVLMIVRMLLQALV
jgi:hypothetical protein